MRLNPFNTDQDRLDLRRKDIDAANDQHVVGAAAHTCDAGMGPAADARFIGYAGNIPGAVTDQGNTLLGDGCNDQFTAFTLSQALTGFGIYDLRDEVVLPDMQTLFGLDALDCHAWSHDLRQSVDIYGCQVKLFLDLITHGFRPRFGTEDPDPQLQGAEVHSFLMGRLSHK